MVLVNFRQIFGKLELDEQKDSLLLFLLVPIFVFAETAILMNMGFFSSAHLLFVSGYVTMSLVAVVCKQMSSLKQWFKHIFLTLFLLFTFFELWLFNFFPQAPEMIFVVLTLSLIYLNVRLTLYVGLSSLFFCCLAFFGWRELFFPYIETFSAFLPNLVLLLETTLVLSGVTLLGARFSHYVHSADHQQKLLHQFQEHSILIQQQNNALQEYAKQVEWLTVQEERNRLLRELKTTVGGSLSSLWPDAESLYHAKQESEHTQLKQVQLSTFSANYIRFIKDKLEELNGNVPVPIPHALRAMIDDYQAGHDASVNLMVLGEEYDFSPAANVSILRCLQDLFSLTFMENRLSRIDLVVSFQPEHFMVVVEAEYGDAAQFDKEIVAAIRRRVENLRGDYHVLEKAATLHRHTLRIPIRASQVPRHIDVLLVTSHDMIAESIKILLESETDLRILARMSASAEAIVASIESEPDTILFDVHRPDELYSINRLKERWPASKIIAFSTTLEPGLVEEAIKLDIHSFLDKSFLLSSLVHIIRTVHNGNTFLTLEAARKIAGQYTERNDIEPIGRQSDSPSFGLTDKEITILQYLSDGYKYKEIAEKLHFSESTIKNYISIIYSKLEVENRMKAVKKAKELGAIA
ncbi:UNVERIFIED_CONTAM: DNA-binding NarL/FixJ family response regulator [Brevibacillus sp. OAP136]